MNKWYTWTIIAMMLFAAALGVYHLFSSPTLVASLAWMGLSALFNVILPVIFHLKSPEEYVIINKQILSGETPVTPFNKHPGEKK